MVAPGTAPAPATAPAPGTATAPGTASAPGTAAAPEETSSAAASPGSAPAGGAGLPGTAPTDVSFPPAGQRLTCPTATVDVHDADGLTAALAGARAGDVIVLAAGTYTGHFVGTAKATVAKPVFVCGPRQAVIDGDGVDDGYAWHLDGATGWRLLGSTIQNSQKGVMVDDGVDNVIEGLLLENIGDEAIHGWGTGNVFRGNTANVNGPGHGFAATNTDGTMIGCDNIVTGAGKGFADVKCTP